MLPLKRPSTAPVGSKTYPLGEQYELSTPSHTSAVIALSHTPVEHKLYSAMLAAPATEGESLTFTARSLASLTGIRSLSTVRRALEGLLSKLSIERAIKVNGVSGNAYRVLQPEEVLARRKQEQVANETGPTAIAGNHVLERAVARVAGNAMLSRREAQVTLCCLEGLTNAEIGKRLDVSEQTVKFHLRHVFVKFRVKRRAELISLLLR